MTARAKEEIRSGRQLIIFPEGTRRPPGAEPRYKFGVAHLYAEVGVPCVPVALNSGLFWPRRAFLRLPGTIVVEFLPPIPPGLDKERFLQRLQSDIETATARLIAEGEAELKSLGLRRQAVAAKNDAKLTVRKLRVVVPGNGHGTFALRLKKKSFERRAVPGTKISAGAFVESLYPPKWRFLYALKTSDRWTAGVRDDRPGSRAVQPAGSSPASPGSGRHVTTTAPAAHARLWRSSKLIGLNVYNDQNEKLGDINEILLDKSGKVEGVVIGVGGFLGMGQHDIKVDMAKLKFVDEPVRTSSATTTTTTTTGAAAIVRPRPRPRPLDREEWYPDHAVLSGASKDQLKSMPQFKYN